MHATFDFHSMIRVLWGFSNPQQAANILCDFPSVGRLRELQESFQVAEASPSDRFKRIRVLLLLVELKERAQWPLGIVYVSRFDKTADVIYFGVPSAKMVLLVRQTPQTAVDVWVAGASAYATGMNTTVSVRMLRPFSVPQEWQFFENGEIAVEVRGDCSRISLLGHHCTTHHCPLCILLQLGLCSSCSWHSVSESGPQRCLHIFGEVLVPGQGLSVTGHLCHGDGRVSMVLCHVTQGVGDLNSVHGFSEWKHHVQLNWVLPLLPNAPLSPSHSQAYSLPFAVNGLPSSYYEHFFVLPCGKNSQISSLLDEWGYSARDDG